VGVYQRSVLFPADNKGVYKGHDRSSSPPYTVDNIQIRLLSVFITRELNGDELLGLYKQDDDINTREQDISNTEEVAFGAE
jgi:hypothetical protein